MSASPRRRSLLGRPGAPRRRANERRSVTAPLRIGEDLRKMTIEELEALADEDFPEDDEEWEDETFEGEDETFEGEDETLDDPGGELARALGEDTVRSPDAVAEGTVWTIDARPPAVQPAKNDSTPLAAEPVPAPTGLSLRRPGSPEPLDVIERGVPGEAHGGSDADDSFALDDEPSEEVRKDPRFKGLDFTGHGAEPELLPVPAAPPAPAGKGAEAETVRLPRASSDEPVLPIVGMVAALLGSGGMVALSLLVAVGVAALGLVWTVTASDDAAEAVPAVVEPVAPAPEPIVVTPLPPAEPVVEPEPVEEPVEEAAPAPAVRRRPKPEPEPVVVEPEPVVAPPPEPVPEPAVVVEDPPEDEKRGLFGKKKKK